MIPGEVIVPMLFSWVKEQYHLAANGIKGRGLIVFEIVATLASQRQVVHRIVATHILWRDMFNRESLCRVCLLAETVFATALSTLADQSPQLARNTLLRHAVPV